MSRKVVVSNQDSRIRYEGEWTPTNSSLYSTLVSSGPSPPLESVLHEATSNNSSFTFAFNGTSVDVLGLLDNSSPSQVEVRCSIDGASIHLTTTLEENDAPLCSSSILPNGPHELVVNVTSTNTHFFLDTIQYVPSNDALFDNATVIIPNTDPSISYSPGWSPSKGLVANVTKTTGAFVNISFIGDSIVWFGAILTSEPQHAGSLAQYSMDHGSMFNFTLPSSPLNSSIDIQNVPFFESALEQGSHTLFVLYLGNESMTPLTLSNLVVTNGSDPTIPFGSTTLAPLPALSSIPITRDDNNRPGNTVGTAVGAAVGATVVLGLIFALLFIHRRRWLRSRRDGERSNGGNGVRYINIEPSPMQSSQLVSQTVSPSPRNSLYTWRR